jgi:glutathionylspermidine synthase
MAAWVKKPLLGREGANLTLHQAGVDLETGGSYGAEGFVFQELAPPSRFNGMHAVLGSWLIGEGSSGIGIRESESPIITNTSRFVPHLIG